MRVNYKALQLALYGSGVEVYIGCDPNTGYSRIVVLDSRSILTLNWTDENNIGSVVSLSVNRNTLIHAIRNGPPSNFNYHIGFRPNSSNLILFDDGVRQKSLDDTKKESGTISVIPYISIDVNRWNQVYDGFCTHANEIYGNVSLDFDKIKYVMDFLSNYISGGEFPSGQYRVVNFQITNEYKPILIQAFMRDNNNLLYDLDVAVFPFIK